MAKQLTFYTTQICRLCDEALDELRPLLGAELELKIIDVAQSDELIEEYGKRIPVIESQGRELGWPFDTQSVYEFLMEGA